MIVAVFSSLMMFSHFAQATFADPVKRMGEIQ
jgi:hypothetical protein